MKRSPSDPGDASDIRSGNMYVYNDVHPTVNHESKIREECKIF
jgi:hypothetical protein